MSAPKFTPGPWATHPDRPTQVMDCADESFIADCEGLEPGGCPSDEANARLVAAAPELYQSLLEMVEDSDDVDDGDLPKISAATLTRARQALAKAVQP